MKGDEDMDTKNIKTLIGILEESGLESLSYKADGVEISLSKGTAGLPVVEQRSPPVSDSSPSALEKTINSPLVGIFYVRSAPDEEAFVKPGSSVKVGDTLCIVEAMKVMNEIKASSDGVIQRVLVEDGAMVEFDQPLFVIG